MDRRAICKVRGSGTGPNRGQHLYLDRFGHRRSDFGRGFHDYERWRFIKAKWHRMVVDARTGTVEAPSTNLQAPSTREAPSASGKIREIRAIRGQTGL